MWWSAGGSRASPAPPRCPRRDRDRQALALGVPGHRTRTRTCRASPRCGGPRSAGLRRAQASVALRGRALAELVRIGAVAGPEVLAAGTYVTPDLGETILADPRLARLHRGVESEADIRHLVRVNLDRGATVIKTRTTERAGTPTTDPRMQVYSERQLRAVVEEAATRGAHVLTHAHGDEGAWSAVRAGVRSIGTAPSERLHARGSWRGRHLPRAPLRDAQDSCSRLRLRLPVVRNRGLLCCRSPATWCGARARGRKITPASTPLRRGSLSRVSQDGRLVEEMGSRRLRRSARPVLNAAALRHRARTDSLRRRGRPHVVTPTPGRHPPMQYAIVCSRRRVALNRLRSQSRLAHRAYSLRRAVRVLAASRLPPPARSATAQPAPVPLPLVPSRARGSAAPIDGAPPPLGRTSPEPGRPDLRDPARSSSSRDVDGWRPGEERVVDARATSTPALVELAAPCVTLRPRNRTDLPRGDGHT